MLYYIKASQPADGARRSAPLLLREAAVGFCICAPGSWPRATSAVPSKTNKQANKTIKLIKSIQPRK